MSRVLAGRYELEVPLGSGGFGEVWRGKDVATREPVAVKLVELAGIEDAGQLAETITRFRREAATLASLGHPNIVAAREAGRVGKELFLVMELAAGSSLSGLLEQRAAAGLEDLPVSSVLRIAQQVSAGLAAAHAAGVVHRDIKPGNLMIGPRLRVKIVDFGIARLVDDSSPRLTQPGMALGTLAYASPEQLSGGDLDGRCDLYSLGCVLYELLAGHRPFTADNPHALLRMQLLAQPVPLDAIRTDLPAGLSALVADMLSKDPGERPASAPAVSERVSAILADLENAAPATEAGRVTVTPGASVTMMQAPDAGTADAGTADAGTADAGTADAGTADAGTPEAGTPDAGTLRPQLTPEAGRVTMLTPDRLAQLSEPGPDPAGLNPAGVGAALAAGAGAAAAAGAGAGVAEGAVTMTVNGAPRDAGTPTWPEVARARPRRRRRPRWRGVLSTLITVAVVAGAGAYAWVKLHGSLEVTGVSVALANQPGNRCDVTVRVIGTIDTNGHGGQVSYQWVRDSTDPLPAAAVSAGSGQQAVRVGMDWTFDGTGTQNALVELRVLSPGTGVANTEFTYSCAS